MPRKRRLTKLRERRLRWSDVTIREQLDFLFVGWSPPKHGSEPGCWLTGSGRYECPWRTWDEYLTDWQLVREDALEYWEGHHADHLAHARAEVAKREAKLREEEAQGEAECWLSLYQNLYEDALEGLAREETRELPFAEIEYQRALKGQPPRTHAERDGDEWGEAEDEAEAEDPETVPEAS